MPGPMDALRKAYTIGPDAEQQQIDAMGGVQQQAMPMGFGGLAQTLRPGAAEGWGPAVKALLGWRQKVAPGPSGSPLWPSSRMPGPVQETLGERMAEFAPQGGEEMYNVARRALKPVMDPLEATYERIKAAKGRMLQPAAPATPNPMQEFYRANPAASFEPGGGRSTGSFSPTNLLTGEPEGLSSITGLLKAFSR